MRRGSKAKIVGEVFNEGRTWLKTSRGNYLAKEFMTRGNLRVKSAVSGYAVTTRYGIRKRGLWATKGYHTGEDTAAPFGARCVAVRAGQVFKVQDTVLGNCLLLYADNRRTYWYCHLQRYAVRDLAYVTPGQTIGYVGDSGTGARGPHLHHEDHLGHTLSWWAPDRNPTW